MKCYVKLSSFKEFHSKCEESEQLWDHYIQHDNDFSDEDMESEAFTFDEGNVEAEQTPVVVNKKTPVKARKKVSVSKKIKPKSNLLARELDLIEKDIADKERSKSQLTEEDVKLQRFYGFACVICKPKENFYSITSYKNHMKVLHKDTSATIKCCDKNMTKRHQLLEHMTFHSDPTRLLCDFCQKIFADRKGLLAHIKRKHGTEEDKKYQCDYCKKRFVTFEPLKQHLLSHLSEETREQMRTHLCNECGQTFMQKHILQSHIKYVHLKQGFICDLCARHFKSRFDYELHRRNAHGEAGPSREQCPICNQWYSNEKAVREHIRYLHERTQKIPCKICGEELSSKPSLRSHMKMKHETKMYRCNFCDKALPTAIRLKEHEAMHTGISLYDCMYCTKEFNMKSNMYKHLKAIHSKEWERDKADKKQNPDKWKNKEQKVVTKVKE